LLKFFINRLALENERWKQCEIPVDFKNLVDHIITNGIGAQNKKFDSKVKNSSEFLLINNEKYVIFG
jgi:vacuolar protein sorting-associated protein 54